MTPPSVPTLLPQPFCIGGRAAVTVCVDAAAARINVMANGLQTTASLYYSSGHAIQANASAPSRCGWVTAGFEMRRCPG